MKKIYLILVLLSASLVDSLPSHAGNPDRAGQAGATELLINPWARSSGWGGFNTANIKGIESERVNIAGLAFTNKTDLHLSRTAWLSGSDININAIGFGQRMSESSVLGISIMSVDFGDINVTTVENPDATLGTFSPQLLNLGISYARSFSDRIHGGVTGRIISQSISTVTAQGFSIDAGIQYVTGEEKQFRFGVALRNVGTPMRFSGEGLATNGQVNDRIDAISLSLSQRSERFELPSLMNIGMSYDFNFSENTQLTFIGNFTSNSFTNDQYGIGAQFNLKNFLQLRAGYNYENGINDINTTTNASSGLSAGVSVDVPLSDGGQRFGFDYSYRPTNPFNGTHSFGIRFNL